MHLLHTFPLSSGARSPNRRLMAAVVVPVILFTWLTSSAAQSADVVRVEEDWELILDVVSESKHAPQFETLMSPFAHADWLFGRVTWNYREEPDYIPGGLQVQAWDGAHVATVRNHEDDQLSIAGETVRWTQSLSTTGDYLVFRIKNGTSATWGTFGPASVYLDADLPHLNGYSPGLSKAMSGITYGANRVILLRIKQVRRYDADGQLLSTDDTSRVIHER